MARSLLTLASAAFFVYDVATDWALYLSVSRSGAHPWWSGLLLAFLILPQVVCSGGMAHYLKTRGAWNKVKEAQEYDCCCGFCTLLFMIGYILFSALAVAACDVLMLLRAVPVLGPASVSYTHLTLPTILLV